ncbi:MAG: oligosaccharide flippase family protein, partial [Clostridia bacterium]|nr:oligosaccharide flippase family protein [Clostridia bacterium]
MLKKLIQKYKDSDVVFKASIWFVLVTVINNAASLLTQPIVNRILSVEEVGIYGVYLTWNSILSILSTFNLCYGVLEVLITKDKADSDNIVSSLATVSSIIWTVFFTLVFIFINPISALLKLKPIYIVILALTVWGDAMVQFWCVKKRFFYLYRQYSALMVALFLTKSVLSVTMAYFFSDRVLGRVLGMCLPPLLAAVVLYISSLKRTGFRGITKYWTRGIKFNIPLIPHYLSSILLASSDKIMIQHLSDETSLGLYSLAYTFSGLALIVFNAVNNAYTPTAYELIREENYKELSKKTKPIIFIAVAFSILLMLMAPEGVYIIGGEEYMSCLEIIPVLVLGIFFSSFYFIFSNIEFVYERTKLVFPITLLGAGLNIVLNYIFIPKVGYGAAAYTTLISYIVVALCHYFATLRIIKRNAYPMGAICLYLGVLIGATLLMPLLPSKRRSA